MTEPNEPTYQLIVRQRAAAFPDMDDLLRTLQADFGLDAYTARQRLVGPALALFGKGSEKNTAKIADLLRHYGMACWQVQPQKPAFAPERIRGLEIRQDAVLFTTQKGTIRLDQGAAVVAVLADLTGGLVDKQLKRVLAQNTYRGSESMSLLSQEEMVQTVFRGQAVLDCYLLDEQDDIQSAFRVLPGRFNVEGLGGRAGLSSRQNLEAVMRLVEEYAGRFRLFADFGLGQLPNCQVVRANESVSAVTDNLASLTRYGWLVASLQGDGLRPDQSPEPADAALAAGVAAAAVVAQPALGAAIAGTGGVDTVPGLGEVARELREAVVDEGRDGAEVLQVPKDLPPPPDAPQRSLSPRQILTTLGTFAVVGLFVLLDQGGLHLLGPVLHYAGAAGVLPGLIAAGLFWGAFHFIRLKRRIENTPTSKIRSLAVGMVEIHGRARRRYALVAPMTQSACVYYRLRKYRKDNNDRWKLVRQIDSRHVPFLVDDGTGKVEVNPSGASVRAKTTHTGYPGQSALTFTAFSRSDEDEKWVEDIIYEGTTLYVLGFAEPVREQKMSLRERTMQRLRDLKLDPQAMRRYDTNGDGQIDEDEWEVARNDAEQQALQEHLAEGQTRKRQEEHIVITRPGQRGLPFVVAETVDEAHLTRNYGLFSIPLLLAALATAGFALFKFLEFIGVR